MTHVMIDKNRHCGHKGHTENSGVGPVGTLRKISTAIGNQHECEQRADICKIRQRADIENSCRNPHKKTCYPSRDVRGTKTLMRHAKISPGSNPSRDMANHTRVCPY